MPILIVVDDPDDLALNFEECELVSAKAYVSDHQYAELRSAKVFNLCRSYRYQSTGYYVSLLASARGHKPIPNISTILDLKSQSIIRIASEELDDLIQKSLSPIQSKTFVLSIYFGRNLARRHEQLSQYLFKLFEAPFLRSIFFYNEKNKKWQIQNINPIAVHDISEEHRSFVVETAKEFFFKKRPSVPRRTPSRFDLAILYNPNEEEPPSDPKAIQRFVKAAESLRMATEIIRKEDYARLSEFDALFIRETTNVKNHTYRFARKAMAEGLITVDDPESILKCTNKVFLAELLERHKVSTPKTVIAYKDNIKNIFDILGLPCILKQPDSSFSQGVVMVTTEEELIRHSKLLLENSDLIIAQEFLSTPFDWRVGIFDRHPLYVCKYFMAKKHWQIIKRDSNGLMTHYGRSEPLAIEHAPTELIRNALRAANLIGDGFYGVDIKQIEDKYYVIEVNDNPNIDYGVEDAVLKMELYLRIMRIILGRIEKQKEKGYLWW